MLIEQNTNYAYKFKDIEAPDFEKVCALAAEFMRKLSPKAQYKVIINLLKQVRGC